eukprot:333324-Rhodomonas_salina.1
MDVFSNQLIPVMEKQTGQGEQQVSRRSRKGVPKRWTQADSWSDEEWEDDDHDCTEHRPKT